MKSKVVNNIKYILSENKKFKTTRVSFVFSLPISSNITADGIVLNDLMVVSCNKYNTIKQFNDMLYNLYDLKVTSNVSQKGLLYVFEISFSFINKQFLKEDIEEKVMDFIKEVIMFPNFSDEYIDNIKNKRILEIETIYDDKMYYSIEKLRECLDQSRNIIAEVNSNIESIKLVNKESLQLFHNMLVNDANIVVLIDSPRSLEIQDKIEKSISLLGSSNTYSYLHNFLENKDEQFVSEHQNLAQSKFALGIKLNIEQSDFKKFQVFNAIFGGYAFSRLFTNIREKQSLAYTIKSSYLPSLNIMYIYGGTNNGDLSKDDYSAIEKIVLTLKQDLNEIKALVISDEEMQQAKIMLINSLKTAMDSQPMLQEIYYQNHLVNKEFSFEDYVSEINAVSKEDVAIMAKEVRIDTIYLLRGDK